MSKLNLKDNIWIEGFTREELFGLSKEDWRNIVDDVSVDKMLYSGKTSEIPEEIAKELVDTIPHILYGMRITDTSGNDVLFKNYKINKFVKKSGKRSIQSACDKEYCIIYKTN